MPLYTFFCRRVDGSTPTFEAHELRTDAEAVALSQALLLQHPTCSEVEVLDGEREVDRCVRIPTATEPLVGSLPELKRALDVADPGAAVIVTDRHGSVVLWNRAATRLYGWTPSEALGAPIVEMTPAVQSKRRAKAIMEELQAGKPWEGEIVLRRRDGSPFRAFVADVPLAEAGTEDVLILGISAPAESRATVWEAQSKILGELGRA